MAQYHYPDLKAESDEIRLLVLSEDTDQLQCELKHVSLNDKPNFIALSYEWGVIEMRCQIRINDQNGASQGSVAITPSLHNALRDILTSILKPKIVFADQVSINQSDKQEVGQQVSLMGQIYREAAMVVTYLGPYQKGDEEGCALLRRIHQHFEPHWLEIWDISTRRSFKEAEISEYVMQAE
jgi:hypothetical protein